MKLLIMVLLFGLDSTSYAGVSFPNECKVKSGFSNNGYITLMNLRNLPYVEVDGEVFYLDFGGISGKNQLYAYNEAADISAKLALSFGNRFAAKVEFDGKVVARGFCE